MKTWNDFEVQRIYGISNLVEIFISFFRKEDFKLHSNYKIKCNCPFHNDNNNSAIIDTYKNIFTCSVCHEVANPVQFIMRYKKLNYPEALEYLFNFYKLNDNYPCEDEISIQAEKASITFEEIAINAEVDFDSNDFKDGFFHGAKYVIEEFIKKSVKY